MSRSELYVQDHKRQTDCAIHRACALLASDPHTFKTFRSLDLPIVMTRKMEHILLASADHLPIEHAIRRAELLGLGAPAEIVKAVMSTRFATDLRPSDLWRSVWMFLIANAGDLVPMQIGPLIDYIQAVRQDRTQDGMVEFGASQPAFSMKGRTVQSMLRLMREWHRSLGTGVATLSWVRSPFEPLIFEDPNRDASEMPRRWQMIELINGAQLRREGAALHHCVASYADRCYRGSSSIWSLIRRGVRSFKLAVGPIVRPPENRFNSWKIGPLGRDCKWLSEPQPFPAPRLPNPPSSKL